jgi:hypothetical protein
VRSLRVGGNQLRVWLDEPLPATYVGERVLLLEHSTAVHPVRPRARGAVEYVGAQYGHPSSYGLLGGIFEPTMSDVLRLEIHETNVRTGPTISQKTATGAEMTWHTDPQVGLSSEFAEAVRSAARPQLKDLGRLGAGVLTLNSAMYQEVGSSQAVFGLLLSVLAELMQSPRAPSDQQITDWFERAFDRWRRGHV